MNFGQVLHGLKTNNGHTGDERKEANIGRRFAREGWNGKGMWIALQVPGHLSKMSLPYIYMRTAQGDLVPWLASQTDVLAEDWLELDS